MLKIIAYEHQIVTAYGNVARVTRSVCTKRVPETAVPPQHDYLFREVIHHVESVRSCRHGGKGEHMLWFDDVERHSQVVEYDDLIIQSVSHQYLPVACIHGDGNRTCQIAA